MPRPLTAHITQILMHQLNISIPSHFILFFFQQRIFKTENTLQNVLEQIVISINFIWEIWFEKMTTLKSELGRYVGISSRKEKKKKKNSLTLHQKSQVLFCIPFLMGKKITTLHLDQGTTLFEQQSASFRINRHRCTWCEVVRDMTAAAVPLRIIWCYSHAVHTARGLPQKINK